MKTNVHLLLAVAEAILAVYGLITHNWLLCLIAGGFAIWFLKKSE